MIPTLRIYGIQDQGTYPAPRWTLDHCIALFVDGRLKWALELERYTRRKHDNRLHRFLEQLIEDGVLPLPEHFRIVAVDSLAGRAHQAGCNSGEDTQRPRDHAKGRGPLWPSHVR
jgi:carbamoyltransferase